MVKEAATSEVPYLSTRCPRCGDNVSMPPVTEPVLVVADAQLRYNRTHHLFATLHVCTNARCSGSTVGYYIYQSKREGPVYEYEFHRPEYRALTVPDVVPKRPRTMLQHANDAKDAPVACTAAAVRAVEAMLADQGYNRRSDSLKKRIDAAVTNGDLPKAMGDWAHRVREIGRETHTDEKPAPVPTEKDAEQALLFANTLAQYLFVLPARIPKTRKKRDPRSKSETTKPTKGAQTRKSVGE